ncbi:response regulator [Rhizobium sp. P38BS-XIX]|uniref:response regulator n=1 Tax=Rhizobium sp. P38BS-XIX TaxID=2726740 RepID=UPI0014578869|nr:response regulator [Rhizobium sp. P38BS-XIX]NLR98402.1 response regulator [Rhizobium sp. P38BS-XIX]
MAQRILVADDEPNIRDVICFALDRAGMRTTTARSGTEAMMAFHKGGLDLIVLDVGMPDMDGLEVCRRIRKTSNLPILFLSARDEEIDRILGLEIGGDDYVTKPFSPRELVARVKTILKRTGAGSDLNAANISVSAGLLRLNRGGRTASFADTPLSLTALEFSILDTLLSRPEIVFSRDQLMDAAYGADMQVADRTIDSHIRNLRAKLSAAGGKGIIATVHGIGFKLTSGMEGSA